MIILLVHHEQTVDSFQYQLCLKRIMQNLQMFWPEKISREEFNNIYINPENSVEEKENDGSWICHIMRRLPLHLATEGQRKVGRSKTT